MLSPFKAPEKLVPSPAVAPARAAGRLGVSFGPRFFLLLVVGFVWLGPAWREPRFLMAIPAWYVLLLAAWAWDLSRLPRPGQIEVGRVWTEPLALATSSSVRLEIRNGGRIFLHVVAVDDAAPALCPMPPRLEAAVPRGGEAAVSYSIRPTERGDTRMGDVYLRYQSVLRLAERWALAGVAQAVRVYPHLEQSRRQAMFLIRSRQIQLEKRRKRQRGQGREFETLREYRDGDEMRDVCWTATARRGKPITKVYQVEHSQTVWIVLDSGRLLRARTAGLSKLDHAVNAALALARVAIGAGDLVGLMAYGRAVRQRLAPARGAVQLRAVLERLALLRAEPSEADHAGAAQALLAVQKRRSLIVWLTDLAETAAIPDVIESAAQMAPRHLVLFVAISEPDLYDLAAQRPSGARSMYRYAAAQEMLQRRELLLRTLRQRGVLAVEFRSGLLSTALVNQYLEIKERSLL